MTDETPAPPPETPEAPDAGRVTFQSRVEKLVCEVGDLMEEYERETPLWEAETLLDLTKAALENFWHYLTHPSDLGPPKGYSSAAPVGQRFPSLEGPSWENPEVELRYAVDMDWDKETVLSVQFRREDLGDDHDKWVEAGAKFFLTHRTLYVFNLITRGGRLHTDGEGYAAAIPPDLLERFPSLHALVDGPQTTTTWETSDPVVEPEVEPEARAAYDARYRPFVLSHYAVASLSHEWILHAWETTPPAELDPAIANLGLSPREIWDRLEPETRRDFLYNVLDRTVGDKEYASDLLHVEGHVNETPFSATLRVKVHPLVLDTREPRSAFYPLTLELLYDGDLPLAEWSNEDRRKLWDQFEAILDALLDAIRETLTTPEAEAPPEEHVLEPGSGSVSLAGNAPALAVAVTAGTIARSGELYPPGLDAFPSPSPSPEPPPEPAYVGPRVERRYLHDGPTRYDRNALALVLRLGRLHLPRKWTSLKPWADYEREEVARWQAEYGDAAFRNQRTEQSPNAPGKLLTRETRVVGGVSTDAVVLTREARSGLRDRVGCVGFRERRRDKDGRYREYLVKRFRVSGGYVETSLSWYGEAWPLVDEGRDQQAAALQTLREQFQQRELFEDLSPDLQDRINGELTRLGAVRDGRRVMEYILGCLSKDARNPVKIGAWELRTLLECETDPDGFDRVRGCLRALQELRYHLKVAGVPNLSQDAVGPFLSDVEYVGRGPGSHTDGDFFLSVSQYFVGSLRAFENTSPRLRDPRALVGFEWGKDLSEEDHKALAGKYLKGFSALSPYFDRAKGFTETQTGLRQFLEHEITLRKDKARKARRSVVVAPNAPDANEPRIYTREFCPFLLPDRQYHGALGHFSKNPETGRKLMGTARPGTSTSGPHSAGLLQEMGYPPLPRGGAQRRRDALVGDALRDLKAVVEEAFGGVVAGWTNGEWYSLQTATEALSVDALARDVSWFLFLAHDWRDRMTAAIETYHADRHARGETPYQVAVTTDRARAASPEAPEPDLSRIATPASVPLLMRFTARRERLRLTLEAVGRLFGVSKMAIMKWEKKQTPIPADVLPLMARWVEDGTPPSPEDLARLAARRANRPGVKKAGPVTPTE